MPPCHAAVKNLCAPKLFREAIPGNTSTSRSCYAIATASIKVELDISKSTIKFRGVLGIFGDGYFNCFLALIFLEPPNLELE